MDEITIDLLLSNERVAWALAQFVKRASWSQFRENAVSDDEAYLIRDGISELQDALTRHGFNPR